MAEGDQKPKNCTSCNLHMHASNSFVRFKCPACSEGWIIRCDTCRKNAVNYVCGKCEFEGP